MKKFDFYIITGTTAAKYLSDIPKIKDIIKKTYIIHGEKQTVNPDSYFLRFPDKPTSRIIALPAFAGGQLNTAGIKWISSFPENPSKGFPRASAVLILNDPETGYPFACIESSIISASRTASSAVLASEFLVRKSDEIPNLGIVGNGLIAKYIYKHFKGNNWEFDKIYLYDANKLESEKFMNRYIEPKDRLKVVICDNCKDVISNSSILVLTTIETKPYIFDNSLFKHNPLVLNISLRDLSPAIILNSNNITDDIDHCLKANTSLHLTEQATGNRDFVSGTLYDVITNSVFLDKNKPTIFSPFGLGVLDIGLGRYVYDKSILYNQAIRINEFFYELNR